jgi:rhodanese-related sulfurtransferase
MGNVILDVRERDEFEAEHIEDSINAPLSHFASTAPGILNQLKERDILIMCRSGARSKLAAEQLKQLGYSDKISAQIFDGGILEWKRQGKPTLLRQANHLPILRQVQLTVGLLILTSVALGIYVSSWFLAATAFFGAGLTFAGATGFCGMAIVLSKMPWNRANPEAKKELCEASPQSSVCKD